MIKYFCSLFSILFFSFVNAQERQNEEKNSINNINFSLGLVHHRMIDEAFTDSKLLFRGTNFKFNLGYGKEGAKYIFNSLVEASIGKIKSKSGSLPADYYYLSFYLEYLRKLIRYDFLGKKSEFILGIHLSSINQGLVSFAISDNVSIVSLHGIYVNFNKRLILSKNKELQITYLMPMLVYENQVLWNGGANNYTFKELELQNIYKLMFTKGNYSYFDILDNIQFKIEYLNKIGRNNEFIVKYNFFFTSNSIEKPFNAYSNELLIGLKLNF